MTKILLVDDEETFCQLLKMNLEAVGRFQVQYVCDPREAVSTAENYMPDAVLLDLMMPHMEGSEVARLLRANRKTAAIPVFFLTALSDGLEGDEKTSSLGNGVISKPVSVGDLVRQLDKALGKGSKA
ncbi:MAG: response regulator [Elusimicrobia bacterium]|nr:response regulator [Elusimicrobiota bacterium]